MLFGAGLAMMNVRDRSDRVLYEECIRLADLAEPLGFDSLWTAEHHFSGHSPIPNALQMLSFMAARTSKLLLGTAVIVLPWHHPIRVAEEVAMLDNLSGGRVLLGIGRGVSPFEYHGFDIPIAESRARFDEATRLIRTALSNDEFEFDGQFYQVPRISIRPRPVSRPERRLFGAAASQESAELMGRLGIGVFVSPQRDLAPVRQLVGLYRSAAVAGGFQPQPPACHMYVSVASTSEAAHARARRFMTPMFEALDQHYRFSVGSLAGVPGYEHHASSIEAYACTGNREAHKKAVEGFISKHLVGTPEECVTHLRALRDKVGIEHFVGEFYYGGMAEQEAEENMRMFAERVMPQIRADSVGLNTVEDGPLHLNGGE